MSESVIETTDVTTAPEAADSSTEMAAAEATEVAKVFDAEYVAKLRQEAADARVRAKRADAMAAQLVSAYAAADGRLIDAEDLAYNEDMLDVDGNVDRSKVTSAIDALIARKPHLLARRPTKPVPQGATPEPQAISLHQLMRERA